MVVVQKISLDATPTAGEVEYPDSMTDGKTYWLSRSIVVLSHGISGCIERA